MTAQIGYDGFDLVGDSRTELLIDVARVPLQPKGDWVDLEDRLGFRSTQRLWIGDVPGGVMVATWPAELARQARYLYGRGLRGQFNAMFAVAHEPALRSARPGLRAPLRRARVYGDTPTPRNELASVLR